MPKKLPVILSAKEVLSIRDRMNKCGLTVVDMHTDFYPRIHINSLRNKVKGIGAMTIDEYEEVMRIIKKTEKRLERIVSHNQ